MNKIILSVLVALTGATIPSIVIAGSGSWYLTPGQKGACGEECYTAPTAWIDEAQGSHSFGVTCDATFVMGGAAMQVSRPPFSEAEMVVDDRSLGRFSVQNGLNDVYIRPTDANGRSSTEVLSALEAGSKLTFNIAGSSSIKFTLTDSKSAIRSMKRSCKQ